MIKLDSPSYGFIDITPIDNSDRYKVNQVLNISLKNRIAAAVKAAFYYLRSHFTKSLKDQSLYEHAWKLACLQPFEAEITLDFMKTARVVAGSLHEPEKIAKGLVNAGWLKKGESNGKQSTIETPKLEPEVVASTPKTEKPKKGINLKPRGPLYIVVKRYLDIQEKIFTRFGNLHQRFQMTQGQYSQNKEVTTDLLEAMKEFDAEKAKLQKSLEYLDKENTHIDEEMAFIKELYERANPEHVKKHEKDLALYLVKKDSKHFELLPDHLQNDFDIVLATVIQDLKILPKIDPKFLKDKNVALAAARNRFIYSNIFLQPLEIFDESLRNDHDVIIAMVKSNLDCFKNIPEELKNNREFILKLVSEIPFTFSQIRDDFKDDPDIIEAAMRTDPLVFNKLKPSFKSDKKWVLLALKTGNHCGEIEKVFEQFHKDKDITLAAIHSSHARAYRSCHLKNDLDVIEAALQKGKASITDIPNELRNERRFVLAAVTGNKNDLQSVDPQFKGDEEIVWNAIINHPDDLKYASETILNNKDFILRIAKKIGALYVFAYANARFKDDEDLLTIAVAQHHTALKHASPRVKENANLAALAVRCYPKAYKYVSPSIQQHDAIQTELKKHNQVPDIDPSISDSFLKDVLPSPQVREIVADYLKIGEPNPYLVLDELEQITFDYQAILDYLDSIHLLFPEKRELRHKYIEALQNLKFSIPKKGESYDLFVFLSLTEQLKKDNPVQAEIAELMNGVKSTKAIHKKIEKDIVPYLETV